MADGSKVPVEYIGTKTLVAKQNGHSLKTRERHVIPTFLKRILSVSKLIDEGYEVSFLPTKAIIKDHSGKTIECPRDKDSGLYYLYTTNAPPSHDAVLATDEWTNVDEDAITPITVAKMPKTMDINDAHNACGHKGELLLKKTYKAIGVTLTGT